MTASICVVLYEQSFAWFVLPPAVPSPVQRLANAPQSAGLDFFDKPGAALSAANAVPWPFGSVSASSFLFEVHHRVANPFARTLATSGNAPAARRPVANLHPRAASWHRQILPGRRRSSPRNKSALSIAWLSHRPRPADWQRAFQAAASLFKRSCSLTYFACGSLIDLCRGFGQV
jgi:hypothetical protein